ncbi:unnamed protein product [Brassicogethes aeneus]|uniref:Uncharacterized protein n=1 Tax=Brassicogethes aeneus TaxID=1431903 RepID=A0A9P0FLI0_BRAAE|nr:unnamed protein product [Brassicogethes aeneus]
MKDKTFNDCLKENELSAWNSIKGVIEGLLGNNRDENYRDLVNTMMISFEKMGVNMSLNVNLLHAHLDLFENQLSTESDEQGERFH